RGRPPDAGGGEHPLAVDLDHAGAAIAVGPVARFRQPAQMRDLDALALRRLPDRLARRGLDLDAVEGKADRLAHFGSPSGVPLFRVVLKTVVPAEAGTHPSTARKAEKWVPA